MIYYYATFRLPWRENPSIAILLPVAKLVPVN